MSKYLKLGFYPLLTAFWLVFSAVADAQNFDEVSDPQAQQWIDAFDQSYATDLAKARDSLNQLRAYALEKEDPELLVVYANRVLGHFRYTENLPSVIQDLKAFLEQQEDNMALEQLHYLQLAVASIQIQQQIQIDEAERTLMRLENNSQAQSLYPFIKKTLGDLYQSVGEYPKSLEFYTEALRLNDTAEFQANVYNNLGNVTGYLEDWQNSINYYQRALELYDILNLPKDQIAVQANLGASYRAAGQPQQALEAYQLGIEALSGLDSPDLEAQLQMNLGNLYVDLGETEGALLALNRSLEVCLAENFSYCVLLNHLNIGYAHYVNQNYQQALKFYDLAMSDLERIDAPYIERQLMDNYSDLYRDIGDFETALEYADRYQQLDRQLINAEAKASAEEIQTRYETELKDAELEIQAEQIERQRAQIQIGIIAAIGVVSLLAVIIFFLSFRTRALQSLYERNQDLLRQNEVNRLLTTGQLRTDHSGSTATSPEPSSAGLEQVFERVTHALERERLYKDPNLSLNELASHVASNSTYVSNAISQFANSNFNNLVNYFRIMDARRKLNAEGSNASITELMHECGFNSKASFYRAFSKHVGMTPSQYLQRLKVNQSS